jgi:hypothetical protein
MKLRLEEFKTDVLKRLKEDLFNITIVDNKEKEIKGFKYCNTERILMFIVDYADVEQVGELYYRCNYV